MSRHQRSRFQRVPRRDRVVVSWLFPQDVSGHFMVSLLNMVGFDIHKAGGRILSGGLLPLQSGPNLSTARNKQASLFLEKDADWLLIIDSDMAFDPDALERLLAEADPVKAPIVGGLCFGKHPKLDGTDEYWPTLYGLNEDMTMYRFNEWPENTMMPVNATGTAFLLIHRSVLEAMRERFKDRAPWIWFEHLNLNGVLWGEDTTFCLRAQQCGFPVYVHTGVGITHLKQEAITADVYGRWRAGGGAEIQKVPVTE